MEYAIYKFEEVPFTLDGTPYLARGEIGIYYSIERGDRDIGERDYFIKWEATGSIDAELIDDDGEQARTVTNGSPADIKAALTAAVIVNRSDHILLLWSVSPAATDTGATAPSNFTGNRHD